MHLAHYKQHDARDCIHCVMKLNQRINDVFVELAGISFFISDDNNVWPQTFLGRQYKFGGESLKLIQEHGFAQYINTHQFHMGMPVKLWRIAGCLGFVTDLDRQHAQRLLRTLGKYHGTTYADTAAHIALQFSVDALE